jgi:hypothetical protein
VERWPAVIAPIANHGRERANKWGRADSEWGRRDGASAGGRGRWATWAV